MKKPLGLLAIGALMLSPWITARAVSFGFSPTILELNVGKKTTGSFVITNSDTQPIEFKAEALSWTQPDGNDVYTPTREILVNPTRFTIPAGGKQTVRIGLRGKLTQSQAAYRVSLQQVAPSDSSTQAQISVKAGEDATLNLKILYRLMLPVFYQQSDIQSNASWTVARDKDDLVLVGKNTGTAYSAYRSMKVSAGEAQMDLGNRYILANSTLKIALKGWAKLSGNLTLSRTENGETKNETLDIPSL